jgi:GTP-binding protein HflX
LKPLEASKRARNAPQPTEKDRTRACIILPVLPPGHQDEHSGAGIRAPDARLEEAIGLAEAIDLDVVHSRVVKLQKIRPGTLLGTGSVEEIGLTLQVEDAGLVVVDHALSPVQQRNLEKAWKAKVIDRTGLILEIFGRRARTKEGGLQVELAHLTYQKSRLVRSWTHLERQRGGVGFLGGPGETQIEADRRMLQERITRVRRDLEQVRAQRKLQRSGRQRVPFPAVALVGYTNAGKSTLFNRLTEARVLAQDMLFATLDPTVRVIDLPHGRKISLSDTVGFISDLPTDLVAAFRATLEEVIDADLVLHVRDMSHPDSTAQAQDVIAVLRLLGLDPEQDQLVEVWNKMDLLPQPQRDLLMGQAESRRAQNRLRAPICVSAQTGEGIEHLLDAVEQCLNQSSRTFQITVPLDDGQLLNWLYETCEVLSRQDRSDAPLTHIEVRVPATAESRFRDRFPDAAKAA